MDSKIQVLGIVGSGLMGTGIAEVAARAGLTTILVKATPGDITAVRARIEQSLAKQVERGKLSGADATASLARLTVTDDLAAVAEADLVIEAVVEDLETKRTLFAKLDAIVKPDAIFASNTSTLKIGELARDSSRMTRFIGLHFFSPVPLMNLVELAYLPETPGDVVTAASAFVEQLGKTPVAVLDSTGFIVNRLLVPLLVGAIAAYEQGLAEPRHIDTAMRLGCNHPLGPLALADLIGLDIVYAMAKLLYADFQDARYRPPALLRRLVADGHLGKKAGRGLYDYSSGKPTTNHEAWTLVKAGAFAPSAAIHAA